MSKLYLLILISFCALTMINAQIAYKITPDKIIIKDKNNFDDNVTEGFINNTEDTVIIYLKRYVKNFEDNLEDKRTRGFTQIILDNANTTLKNHSSPVLGKPKEETTIIRRTTLSDDQKEDDIFSLDGDLPDLSNFIIPDEDSTRKINEELPAVYDTAAIIKERLVTNRLIIPPHDSAQYQYSLDLKFYDLQKGKYKVISYYYMDEYISEEIGAELYKEEKDKILTGELKSNEIEVTVE